MATRLRERHEVRVDGELAFLDFLENTLALSVQEFGQGGYRTTNVSSGLHETLRAFAGEAHVNCWCACTSSHAAGIGPAIVIPHLAASSRFEVAHLVTRVPTSA
jgi:hypothetical protein